MASRSGLRVRHVLAYHFRVETGELVLASQVSFLDRFEKCSGWWAAKASMDILDILGVTASVLMQRANALGCSRSFLIYPISIWLHRSSLFVLVRRVSMLKRLSLRREGVNEVEERPRPD